MTHTFNLSDAYAQIDHLLGIVTGLPASTLETAPETVNVVRPFRDVVDPAGRGTLNLRGRAWGHNGPDVGFRLVHAPFTFEGSFDRNWTIIDSWCPDPDLESQARDLTAELTAGLTAADFDALAGNMCEQEIASEAEALVQLLRSLRERVMLAHRSTLRQALLPETDPLRRATAQSLLSSTFRGTPADLLAVLDEAVTPQVRA